MASGVTDYGYTSWRIRDRIDANSGGHALYLSPGVSVAGDRWIFSTSLGVPVIDDPNGNQDERDFRFLIKLFWKY